MSQTDLTTLQCKCPNIRLAFGYLLLISYLTIGMFLFRFVESPSEEERATVNELERPSNYKPPRIVETIIFDVTKGRQVDVFLDLAFIEKISIASFKNLTSKYAVVKFAKRMSSPTSSGQEGRWDLLGSLFFCLGVVTSIGYGDLVPTTYVGQVCCVMYALWGIPLCFNVARQLANEIASGFCKLDNLFSKLVKKRRRSSEESESDSVGQESKALKISVLTAVFLAIFFVLFTISMASAILLDYVEGWGLHKTLYYTFVSWSTIGFGDLVAGHKQEVFGENYWQFVCYKFFIAFWTLFGIGVAALILKIIDRGLECFLDKVVDSYLLRAQLRSVNAVIDDNDTPAEADKLIDAVGESTSDKKPAQAGDGSAV